MRNQNSSRPIIVYGVPQIVDGLRAAGYAVVTGKDFVETGIAAKRVFDDIGAAHLVIGDDQVPGLQQWCHRAITTLGCTAVHVLMPGMPARLNLGPTPQLQAPITAQEVLTALGLDQIEATPEPEPEAAQSAPPGWEVTTPRRENRANNGWGVAAISADTTLEDAQQQQANEDRTFAEPSPEWGAPPASSVSESPGQPQWVEPPETDDTQGDFFKSPTKFTPSSHQEEDAPWAQMQRAEDPAPEDNSRFGTSERSSFGSSASSDFTSSDSPFSNDSGTSFGSTQDWSIQDNNGGPTQNDQDQNQQEPNGWDSSGEDTDASDHDTSNTGGWGTDSRDQDDWSVGNDRSQPNTNDWGSGEQDQPGNQNSWEPEPHSPAPENSWEERPTRPSNRQEQTTWEAPEQPTSAHTQENNWEAPRNQGGQTAPTGNWSPNPARGGQQPQENSWETPANQGPPQGQNNGWGTPPATSQQPEQNGWESPEPEFNSPNNDFGGQQSQNDGWGAPANDFGGQQNQNDGWGNPPAMSQQPEQNNWGSPEPEFNSPNNDFGGQQSQNDGWGSPANDFGQPAQTAGWNATTDNFNASPAFDANPSFDQNAGWGNTSWEAPAAAPVAAPAPPVIAAPTPLRSRKGHGYIPPTGEKAGKVIFTLGGKGGIGKSTMALQVAQALANAGYRTCLIDGNVGQPDLTAYLRILNGKHNGVELPSIYEGATTGERAAVISPDVLNGARKGFEPVKFNFVAGAPSHLNDANIVNEDIYAKVITTCQEEMSFVVVDLQIIEQSNRSAFVENLVIPALKTGGYGMALSDMSSPGINNLRYIMARLKDEQMDMSRIGLVLNRVENEQAAVAPKVKDVFSTLGVKMLGIITSDASLQAITNSGQLDLGNTEITNVVRRFLRETIGLPQGQFPEITTSARPSTTAKSSGLFGKLWRK